MSFRTVVRRVHDHTQLGASIADAPERDGHPETHSTIGAQYNFLGNQLYFCLLGQAHQPLHQPLHRLFDNHCILRYSPTSYAIAVSMLCFLKPVFG